MRRSFLLVLGLYSLSLYSQHSFKPGNFIDENDQKKEVLIKDEEWRNNPAEFTFRATPDAPEQTASLNSVKEFSINEGAKYIRATINIDQSSEETAKLSRNITPDYLEQTIFLKLLAAGEANLYYHQGKNLKNFFYNKGGGPIEPLIYKKYISQPLDYGSKAIKTNRYYQQQLERDVTCEGHLSNTERVLYTTKDLVKYFNDYNSCLGNTENIGDTPGRTPIHLRLRPGINKSGLALKSGYGQASFEDQYTIRIGIEGEFILPFNNNKWAIIIEPTYQTYTATSFYRDLEVTIYYKSIEVPIGLRHYFYINEDQSFFLNASYLLDFNFGNSRFDMTTFSDMSVATINGNIAIGAGYNYKRLSGEIRYYTGRDLLANGEVARTADYKTTSLILGYKIF